MQADTGRKTFTHAFLLYYLTATLVFPWKPQVGVLLNVQYWVISFVASKVETQRQQQMDAFKWQVGVGCLSNSVAMVTIWKKNFHEIINIWVIYF